MNINLTGFKCFSDFLLPFASDGSSLSIGRAYKLAPAGD